MIAKLIIKNLLVSKKQIIPIALGYMIIVSAFINHYYPWHVFMMVGYLLFCSEASKISFVEKKHSGEILTLSLPVTRNQIVTARYLASFIVFIIGFALWYLTAYINNLIYTDLTMTFEQITYIKVLFMALLLFTIQQSIFLPASFKLKSIALILVLIASFVLAIIPIPTIFASYSRNYNPEFTSDDFGLIVVLSSFIVLLVVSSYILSKKLYQKIDL